VTVAHIDPHALPSDDGSDHHPQHHDDGWGADSDHHAHHNHGHDHLGLAGEHHDHGGWEQSDPSHADSPIVGDVQVEADGSLSLHAASDHGDVEVGDFVDIRLPNGDHVAARVTSADPNDHTYRAVVPAEDAHWLIHHLLGGAVEAGAHIGFEHLYHVSEGALCHGEVVGTDGQHVLLGGADVGSGANGAPVFDDAGHLVGQLVGFDPTQGVNLMVTADHVMSGLADFAKWSAGAAGSAITSLLD
jgi:hypothetical protein